MTVREAAAADGIVRQNLSLETRAELGRRTGLARAAPIRASIAEEVSGWFSRNGKRLLAIVPMTVGLAASHLFGAHIGGLSTATALGIRRVAGTDELSTAERSLEAVRSLAEWCNVTAAEGEIVGRLIRTVKSADSLRVL